MKDMLFISAVVEMVAYNFVFEVELRFNFVFFSFAVTLRRLDYGAWALEMVTPFI